MSKKLRGIIFLFCIGFVFHNFGMEIKMYTIVSSHRWAEAKSHSDMINKLPMLKSIFR